MACILLTPPSIVRRQGWSCCWCAHAAYRVTAPCQHHGGAEEVHKPSSRGPECTLRISPGCAVRHGPGANSTVNLGLRSSHPLSMCKMNMQHRAPSSLTTSVRRELTLAFLQFGVAVGRWVLGGVGRYRARPGSSKKRPSRQHSSEACAQLNGRVNSGEFP